MSRTAKPRRATRRRRAASGTAGTRAAARTRRPALPSPARQRRSGRQAARRSLWSCRDPRPWLGLRGAAPRRRAGVAQTRRRASCETRQGIPPASNLRSGITQRRRRGLGCDLFWGSTGGQGYAVESAETAGASSKFHSVGCKSVSLVCM